MNYLVTLATHGEAGFQDRSASVARLIRQCQELNINTDKFVWDWPRFQSSCLYQGDRDLFTPRNLLGFWSWKSYIISEAIFNIGPQDILLYLDSDLSITRPELITELLDRHDLVFIDSGWDNEQWTPDFYYTLTDTLDIERASIRHVWAAMTIWQPTIEAKKLLSEWFSCTLTAARIHAMQQKLPISRYDQSLLSLLIKRRNWSLVPNSYADAIAHPSGV